MKSASAYPPRSSSLMSSSGMSTRYLRRRLVIAVPVVIFIYAFLHYFQPLRQSHDQRDSYVPYDSNACSQFKGIEDIQIILKTGATEARDKLPVHFDTTFRCSPNVLIYSDLEEELEGYHIHDALDEVSEDKKRNKPEFGLYNRMNKMGRKAIESGELLQGVLGPSWNLDKWKFLPIMSKAYHANPNAKWYLFIEADTYIYFSNLLPWLQQLDSKKPYYLGAQMQIGEVVFGHGGSGYIISNPAMKVGAARYKEDVPKYEEFTDRHWAGDAVLGKLLKDININLRWSWPLLQTRAPWDIDPSEAQWGKSLRCFPAVSYHHVSASEVVEMYKFEQAWMKKNQEAIKHGDVFNQLILPNITPHKDEWEQIYEAQDPHLASKMKVFDYTQENPGTNATEQASFKSHEDCQALCSEAIQCMQFHWEPGHCVLIPNISKGRPRHKNSRSPPESYNGWMVGRIKDTISKYEACPDKPFSWFTLEAIGLP